MARFRGYGQFCPVAMAAEVFAERWTPLVLRELLYGHTRFNELKRGVPLMSPSLLSQRLKQLQFAGIIERTRAADGGPEYRLTEAGQQLRPVIEGLGAWGLRWLQHRTPARNLDVSLLMWDMRRNLRRDVVPADRRAVIEFVVNKMNRATRYFYAVFDCLPLRVESGKRRKQTRMNINDFIGKRLDKIARQKPHITRETNQFNTVPF